MQNTHKTPYPVIDSDPIFSRVVRYFRPTDYAVAAGITALGPAFMYWMEKYQPSGNPGKPLVRAMKLAGGLGAMAGFCTAYMMVSTRFCGLSENAREIKKYREEYARLKAQGKPING
ncbi:hypothetical protein LPJ56_005725, partial [Coemansia sp. RSA 2599]